MYVGESNISNFFISPGDASRGPGWQAAAAAWLVKFLRGEIFDQRCLFGGLSGTRETRRGHQEVFEKDLRYLMDPYAHIPRCFLLFFPAEECIFSGLVGCC